MEYQKRIIEEIQKKLQGKKSIGRVLMEVLDISNDAAYRRYRLETEFSIGEFIKLHQYFNISLDQLTDEQTNSVLFQCKQTNSKIFNLESYLEDILKSLTELAKFEKPSIVLTINNTPFFQLFHFPELLRFRLYFWAKNFLNVKSLQGKSFSDFHFSIAIKESISEILNLYNRIPSTELYDLDVFRGFSREVYYYFESNELTAQEANQLYAEMLLLVQHIQVQAESGKKHQVNRSVQDFDASFEMFYNEMLNASALFYYEAKGFSGLTILQNFLTPLFTDNQQHVLDSKNMLDHLIRNSQNISLTNAKGRTQYFAQIEQTIREYQEKVIPHISD